MRRRRRRGKMERLRKMVEADDFQSRFVAYIVQFEVEAAGVAHRVAVGVPPPQRRRCRLTVGARRSRPPGCGLRGTQRRETNVTIAVADTNAAKKQH